jgi:hypothetical protein
LDDSVVCVDLGREAAILASQATDHRGDACASGVTWRSQGASDARGAYRALHRPRLQGAATATRHPARCLARELQAIGRRSSQR